MLDDDPSATQPPVTTPSCPICFHPTRAGAGKHQLACAPCGHVGGFACLVACARTHAACAVCRAPVRVSDVTRLWLPNAVDACESSSEEAADARGEGLTARDANAAEPVLARGPWKRARTDERGADERVGGVGLMGGEATVSVAEVSSRSQSGCFGGRRSGHVAVAPDGKSLLCAERTDGKDGRDGRVRLYRSSLSRRSEMTLFERSYDRQLDAEEFQRSEDRAAPRIVVPCDPHRAGREARHFILLLDCEICVFVDSVNACQMVYHLKVDEIWRELIGDGSMRQAECGCAKFASFVDAAWSTSPREVEGDGNQNVFYVITHARAADDLAYAVHRVDMRRPRSRHLQKVYFMRYKNCTGLRERPAAFLCSNNGLGVILTLDELSMSGRDDLLTTGPRYESCEIFRSLRSRVPCVPLARLLKPTAGCLGRIQGFFASSTYSTWLNPYENTPDWLIVCYYDGERTRVEKIPSMDGELLETRASIFDRDVRHFDDTLQKMSFRDHNFDGQHLYNLRACHIGGKDIFVGVSYEEAASKLFVYTFGAREDPIILPLSERNDEPLRFDVVRTSASEAIVYVQLAERVPIERDSSSERSITEKVFSLRCR